jgi:repressor LexA
MPPGQLLLTSARMFSTLDPPRQNAHGRNPENVMLDRPSLTDRQQEVFDFIVERVDAWGYPPTIREIGKHLGIRSTNGVADHLKALKRKGYLAQQGQKSRTWQPLGAQAGPRGGDEAADGAQRSGGSIERPLSVPLLGRVAAGEPILAVEDAEAEITVDADWIGDSDEVFALTVAGNSMIDDGIADGDTIFVRRQDDADPGDITVIMIDNEATVKRYYPEGDRVRLQPSNKFMQPIYLTADQARNVRIVGTVMGIWRRL